MSIIKKETQKSAIETASLIGGGVTGVMLSRGGFSLIHDDANNPVSGINWSKIMKRGLIALASGAGAVFVKSDGGLMSLLKGGLMGISAGQTLDLITDVSASTPKTAALATSTSRTDKLLAKSLGLACPGDANFALGRPRAKRRGMKGAEENVQFLQNAYQPETQTLNSLMQKAG